VPRNNHQPPIERSLKGFSPSVQVPRDCVNQELQNCCLPVWRNTLLHVFSLLRSGAFNYCKMFLRQGISISGRYENVTSNLLPTGVAVGNPASAVLPVLEVTSF
jgi:hypothetical protein